MGCRYSARVWDGECKLQILVWNNVQVWRFTPQPHPLLNTMGCTSRASYHWYSYSSSLPNGVLALLHTSLKKSSRYYWVSCNLAVFLISTRLSFSGALEDWDAAFSRCRVQLLRVNERRQKVNLKAALIYTHWSKRLTDRRTAERFQLWQGFNIGVSLLVELLVQRWINVKFFLEFRSTSSLFKFAASSIDSQMICSRFIYFILQYPLIFYLFVTYWCNIYSTLDL